MARALVVREIRKWGYACRLRLIPTRSMSAPRIALIGSVGGYPRCGAGSGASAWRVRPALVAVELVASVGANCPANRGVQMKALSIMCANADQTRRTRSPGMSS